MPETGLQQEAEGGLKADFSTTVCHRVGPSLVTMEGRKKVGELVTVTVA